LSARELVSHDLDVVASAYVNIAGSPDSRFSPSVTKPNRAARSTRIGNLATSSVVARKRLGRGQTTVGHGTECSPRPTMTT